MTKKQQFLTHKTRTNALCLIIFTILIVNLITIPLVSGLLETSTSINIKKEQSYLFDGKEISYNNLWDKYKPIQIKNWYGLPLISKTLAETYISEHTETCGINCHSNIQIKLYEDAPLIDDVRFYTILEDESRIEQGIRSYQFYIKTGEEEKVVNDYDWICTPTGKISINGTKEQTCENELIGTHIEKIPLWTPYQIGTVVDAGVYEIKLEGEKKPTRIVDWVIKTNGIWTTEWATWGFTERMYANWTTQGSAYGPINALYFKSQGFKWGHSYGFDASANLSYFSLYLSNVTEPLGIMSARLYLSDAAEKPTGDPISTNWTIDVTSIETASAFNYTWFNVTMPSVSLINGTNYSLVLNTTSGEIGWSDAIGYDSESWNSNDNGTTWGAYAGHRFNFKAYGLTNNNVVILNSPINNYVSSTNLNDFNCSATTQGGSTLINMSLWHNATGTWERNQTLNKTGTTNESVFTISIPNEQSILWTCEACDNDGDCGFANENRTITIDTSFPTINIIHPATTENIGYAQGNQTLSWIITDASFDSAWYNYNGTNVSVYGATNSTTFQLDDTDRNLTFWANDSVGNVNSTFRSWDYKVFVLNETYTTPTISGIINEFLLELETNGTQVTLAYLNYNNTNVLGSISSSGNYYNLTRNQIAIGVSTSTNIPFYWNVTMSNGYNFTIDSKNQTINPIIINETCGAGKYVIFNFTVVDEITQTKLNGATEDSSIKIDLDLYTLDGAVKLNEFYQNFSQINPIAICIDNNLSNNEQYSIDAQIQYGATNYSSELYNIERYVLNSSTFYNNITLYNLDTTHTQNFRLITRDTSYLPIDGALIQIERKYIEDGTFYTTEIPKTDAKGVTSASLQLNDIIYNFYIYQDGTLISSFTNVLAICQTPLISSCEIDFNAFNTGISADFIEGEDFDFTIDYNDTSKIITSQFEIPSGEPATVYLEVIREDTLGTAVCSDTLTSASGTLNCVVPNSFGNSTVMAKLYKNGIEQGKGSIKTDQNPSDIFGPILIMMSVLVMMTLIGIGISDSPVITGVFIVVGLILLFSMNLVKNTGFIGISATILFFIIAMILVIIKAARRS